MNIVDREIESFLVGLVTAGRRNCVVKLLRNLEWHFILLSFIKVSKLNNHCF